MQEQRSHMFVSLHLHLLALLVTQTCLLTYALENNYIFILDIFA